MNGSVAGGWSFVIAAYVVTIVVLTVYSLQLVARYRKGTRDEQ